MSHPARLRWRYAAQSAIGLLLLVPACAQAATITVDDESDANGGATCTLRNAITSADVDLAAGGCAAGSGADTIVLPAGLYALHLQGTDEDGNALGDLDVNHDVAIQGDGASSTTISGGNLDRVLHILAGHVTIDGLTITGGHTRDGASGTLSIGASGTGSGAGGNAIGTASLNAPDGGGILNAGTLEISRSVLTSNHTGDGGAGGGALGGAGGPTGGAGGTATGGAGAGGGRGGAVYNTGTLTIADSTVSLNSTGTGGTGGFAFGGAGGGGTPPGTGGDATGGAGGVSGEGGGIAGSGALTVTRSKLIGNSTGAGGRNGSAGGGDGGDNTTSGTGAAGGQATVHAAGASGGGGAIAKPGTTTIADSTFSGNETGQGGAGGNPAHGGHGGDGAFGGGNGGAGGAANAATGASGGTGGAVLGGSGLVSISRSTFVSNRTGEGATGLPAFGGNGGDAHGLVPTGGAGGAATSGDGGDAGLGGGVAGTGVVVDDSTFAHNVARPGGIGGTATGGDGGSGGTGTGGAGGHATSGHGGGAGLGGGVFAANLAVRNSTLSGNDASGGFAHGGTAQGGAAGGGITGPGASGTTTPGTSGFGGAHGATQITTGGALQNTVVADNPPQNCSPGLTDAGHNITFPDTTCPGANVDPLLGPLADNGGPTRTFALGPGSPAIDAVPSSGSGCDPIDQRGVVRPQGAACDIGAFEVVPPLAAQAGEPAQPGAGSPSGGGGGIPSPPATVFAGVGLKAQTVKVKKGIARIALTCPSAAVGTCAGTLTLRSSAKGKLLLGHQKFSVKPGGKATVAVKLSKAGLRTLKKSHKLTAVATASARDGSAAPSKASTAKIKLKV